MERSLRVRQLIFLLPPHDTPRASDRNNSEFHVDRTNTVGGVCKQGSTKIYKECGIGEVEDIDHFVMRCEYVAEERVRMERLMIDRVEGWNELGAKEKVMDRVCRDEVVARAVEKMWKKSFVICFRPPLSLICAGLNLCCLVIKRHGEYVFLMN